MPLAPGTRLGPYDIVGVLGAGGMGEVYRARDAKLHRDVAIKVLPDVFASDAERVLRFEREAQTLAALNHPNIAHVHGVIDSPLALVMELVEGPDLTARIGASGMPLEDARPIARQIAEALEAAHERGIIHRDLKPANIKVRDDGVVKVLDFGLAKALDSSGSAAALANSPTFVTAATQVGTILGTAAYMSPEQARGRAVDKRSDIWTFGCILFEMLTGRRPFEGDTITDILGAIVHKAPDLSLLRPDTPPSVRTLIARCLEKDATRRLRDIGEARVVLSGLETDPVDAAGGEVTVPHERRPSRLPWMIAAAAALAAVAFAALWLAAPAPERPPSLRASIEPPDGKAFTGSLALSPDGTRLVFSAAGRDDRQHGLWIQDLATGQAAPIRHTEDGSRPFWSPDGRDIGFFADGRLKRIDLQGGAPQILADAPTPRGAAWGPDGRIVLAPTFRDGLHLLDARGGSRTPLTSLAATETSHRWPVFLPDGRHVLFLSQTAEGGTRDDTSSIDVVALDGGARRRLVGANSSPLYVEPGYLMFWRAGTLLAQRLDPRTVTLSGEPFAVAQDVGYDQNEMALATAASSRLVFLGGGNTGRSVPTIVDRTGQVIKAVTDAGDFECGMALSPDGTRLIAGRTPQGANGCDLWMYDLERGVQTRLTFGERNEYSPVFAPDGQSILFGSDAGKEVVLKFDLSGRGTPETVFQPSEGSSAESPWALSKDGRWMVLSTVEQTTGSDIVRYDFESRTVTPMVATQFAETSAALSPDERWIAYASNRSGRFEIYVEPVNGDGNVWPVSVDGGEVAQWRSDGRELFFYAPPDRMMVVDVLPGDTFRTSPPRELFRAALVRSAGFAVAPGGQRLVVSLSPDRNVRRSMTIISGWRPRETR
ncbi:MAG TPA: protein kinase [Vicinamibacterales bacterium]|nr:protein kinase [Vicinamibacterales bacterium]